MIIKRKTEITIETHSLMIIRTRGGTSAKSIYCQICQAQTAAFAFAQAVLIFRAALPEIERLFLTDQIHFADDAAICGNSLADYFKKEIRYVED